VFQRTYYEQFNGFKCKLGTEYENVMVQNTRGQTHRYVLLVSGTNFKVSRGFWRFLSVPTCTRRDRT